MALSKKRELANQQRQKRTIMIIVMVVVAAIGIGLYIVNSGPSLADPDSFSDGIPMYGPVGLNDAQLACERYARKSLGKKLKTLSMDNRSSRLDLKKGKFMVYMEAYIYRSEAGGGASDHHYINCASDKNELTLAGFEIIKNENEKTKAKRKKKDSRYGWQ